MMQLTLTPDRSDRRRFVRFVRYERYTAAGFTVLVPVRVTRDASGTSLTEVPWSRIERQTGPNEPTPASERWDVERLAAAAAFICTPTEGHPCRT